MAGKAKAVEEVEKTAVEPVVKKRSKNGLTYAQTLEARAQRGSMTHQKKFAVQKAKQKEMKGE